MSGTFFFDYTNINEIRAVSTSLPPQEWAGVRDYFPSP